MKKSTSKYTDCKEIESFEKYIKDKFKDFLDIACNNLPFK